MGSFPWRTHAPRVALLLIIALVAVAAYLWRDADDGIAAELEAVISAAEASRSGAATEAYARRLREHLERQPRDARAWVLYARLQAEADRFGEAGQSYEKALALSSKVARDPLVWCEFADALAMAQGGKLAGRPRELIDRALALDLGNPKALEMAGSAEYEQGRYMQALGFWRPLLAKLDAGSQLHRELAAAIARTERLAATAPAPAARAGN